MANNGYWQDIKNLFKSKQRLREEEAQAVGEAVKSENQILDKLKKLEAEYKSSIKDTTPNFDELFKPVSLERVKYDLDTDEEITRAATEGATAKYADKISSINKETLDKALAVEEKKTAAAETKRATLAEIEALYESLKEKTKNDAVKRGIQRGSIVEGANERYDGMRTAENSAVETDYRNEVETLDTKLAGLENARITALSDIDLKKAVEISESISALNKQREKLKAEETSKNNAVEKQEAKLNADLEKEKEKYIADYNKSKAEEQKLQDAYEKTNGYSGEKLKNYADRYNIALEFYLGLDADIAPKALEASANMKAYLGNYYDKLMEVLNSRTATKTKKFI